MIFKFVALIMLALSANALADGEYIEDVPDRIYTTQQDQKTILKRAELCIVQNVKNDEVRTIGSSTGYTGLFGGSGQRQEAIASIPAMPLIKYRDADAGIIYINNRIDYKADLLEHTVQTEMTLAVKDNKFKIGNKFIQYLQKNAGYGTPLEFQKLPAKRWGSSLPEDTVNAINQMTEKLAACLINPSGDNW